MFDFIKKLSYYPEKCRIALSDELGFSLSTVFLDLSTGCCNYNCIFCDSHFRNTPSRSFTETRLLQMADEMEEMGVDSVLLCGDGGEPLLYPAFSTFSSRLLDIGCKLGIYTNGSHYDDRILDVLARFDFVRVSLNAGTSETYQRVHGIRSERQFTDTLGFVQRVAGLNQNVGVSFVLLEDNIREMYRATTLCRDLGVHFIEFKPAYLKDYSVGRFMYAEKEFIHSELKRCQALATPSFDIVLNNQLADFFKSSSMTVMTTLASPRACKVSKFRLVVNPTGYYLCTPYRGVEDYRIGDPFKETLKQAWFGSKHKRLVDKPCPMRCPYHEQNECLMHGEEMVYLQPLEESESNSQISFL